MILLSKYERQLIVSELKFETSRSGGKGGQHVNKTESKVTLVYNIPASEILSEDQKSRIQKNLASRLSSGVLRISCDHNRSQYRNKSDVISRFFHILEKSLHKAKFRIPTKVPKSVKRKRLKNKKFQQEKKQSRRSVKRGED